MEPIAKLDYKIWYGTEALMNYKHPEYQTMIFDIRGTYITSQSIDTLIEEACIEGGTNSKGRILSTRKRLKYDRLTPLEIDPQYNIYAFPSSAKKNIDFTILFYFQINTYKNISKNKIEVIFESGHSLVVHMSEHVFNEQRRKTADCYASKKKRQIAFDMWKHFGKF